MTLLWFRLHNMENDFELLVTPEGVIPLDVGENGRNYRAHIIPGMREKEWLHVVREGVSLGLFRIITITLGDYQDRLAVLRLELGRDVDWIGGRGVFSRLWELGELMGKEPKAQP